MKPADALAHAALTLAHAQEVLRAARLMRSVLSSGDCGIYFVTAEMTTLARAAAATVPDLTRRQELLAGPAGYMVYDAPICESVGDPGTPESRRQLTEHDHGVALPDGRISAPIQGYTWQVCAVRDLDGQSRPGLVMTWLVWVEPGVLMPADDWVFAFGGEISGRAVMIGDELTCRTLEERFWVTHLLMGQTIAAVEAAHLDRAAQRRRPGLPASAVTVVRLRKTERREHGGDQAQTDWTHRWLVSGHWRQQWYPSAGQHRPLWISPHVSPDRPELPLAVKDRVIAWVR